MPLLRKPEWFKRYVKNMDFHIFLPVGAIAQLPTSVHDGLTIGVYLLFIRFNLWEWSNVFFMGKLEGMMSALY